MPVQDPSVAHASSRARLRDPVLYGRSAISPRLAGRRARWRRSHRIAPVARCASLCGSSGEVSDAHRSLPSAEAFDSKPRGTRHIGLEGLESIARENPQNAFSVRLAPPYEQRYGASRQSLHERCQRFTHQGLKPGWKWYGRNTPPGQSSIALAGLVSMT